jgi:hypothetical protein
MMTSEPTSGPDAPAGLLSRAGAKRVPPWKAAALALDLGPELAGEPFAAAWAAWIDHLHARKRPTPGALRAHLAKCRAVAAHGGPAAAARMLAESISCNAQGIPNWVVDKYTAPGKSGRQPKVEESEEYQRWKKRTKS